MITIKEYTVTSILDESAVRFANLQAVATWREKGSEMTYATLKARSQSVARYLVSIGIEKDDKVAILGESSHNWALSYFSINRAGAIAVPILPNFSKHEVQDILTHSDSKVVIVNAKHADKVMGLGLDVIRMEDMFHIHKQSLIPGIQLICGPYISDIRLRDLLELYGRALERDCVKHDPGAFQNGNAQLVRAGPEVGALERHRYPFWSCGREVALETQCIRQPLVEGRLAL